MMFIYIYLFCLFDHVPFFLLLSCYVSKFDYFGYLFMRSDLSLNTSSDLTAISSIFEGNDGGGGG